MKAVLLVTFRNARGEEAGFEKPVELPFYPRKGDEIKLEFGGPVEVTSSEYDLRSATVWVEAEWPDFDEPWGQTIADMEQSGWKCTGAPREHWLRHLHSVSARAPSEPQ